MRRTGPLCPLVSLDTQEIPVPPALIMHKEVLRHTPGMRKVEQCRAGHVEHGLVKRYLVVYAPVFQKGEDVVPVHGGNTGRTMASGQRRQKKTGSGTSPEPVLQLS